MNRPHSIQALVAAIAYFVIALSSTQLAADVILPAGLAPGSKYEIAFVTADSVPATSTDINYYNSFVTTEAGQDSILSSLRVTWNAIGSTDAVNANVNAPNNGSIPVYNTNGQLVADSSDPLYSGQGIYNSIDYQQDGSISQNFYVWTGSDVHGDLCPITNNSWTNVLGLGDPLVEEGVIPPYPGNTAWLFSGGCSVGSTYPLYALSSPITVPTPEPSTLTLLTAGALGLLGYGWRQRRLAKRTVAPARDDAVATLSFRALCATQARRRAA